MRRNRSRIPWTFTITRRKGSICAAQPRFPRDFFNALAPDGKQFKTGAEVGVVYDPGDPANYRVVGALHERPGTGGAVMLAVLAGLILLVAGTMLVPAGERWRRAQLLGTRLVVPNGWILPPICIYSGASGPQLLGLVWRATVRRTQRGVFRNTVSEQVVGQVRFFLSPAVKAHLDHDPGTAGRYLQAKMVGVGPWWRFSPASHIEILGVPKAVAAELVSLQSPG